MARASCLRDVLLRSSALIGAGCALLVAGPASAAGTLDTLGSWDGSNSVSSWGVGGPTPTYGESFTAPSGATHLSSSNFFISGNGAAVNYQAFVYQWDGSEPIGPALYASPFLTLNTPASGGFASARAMLDAQLVPGNQYVAFYTTQTAPQAGYSSFNWGILPSQAYTDSTFAYTNGDAFSGGWNSWSSNLAMQLQFSDPLRWDPAGAAGTASGGAGTWSNAGSGWKDAGLTGNQAWNGSSAIFAGVAGPVTATGDIAFQQLQFFTDGYAIGAAPGSRLLPDGIATIETDAGVTTTISAPIAGSGGLTKYGQGTLVLSGANSYAGGTILSAGTVQVGSDTVGVPGAITSSALGTGSLTFDGGTLKAGGDFTIANAAFLNATGGAIDAAGHTFTLAGAIADSGGSNVPGALTITDSAGAGGTVVLSGASSYAGGTVLSGGRLRVGIDTNGGPGAITTSAIGTGTLTFDGGTLQGGGDFTIANAAQVNVTGGTLDAAGHTFTYAGAITDNQNLGGSGALTVIDPAGLGGTVVLSGANTYSGGTTLSGGTLRIGADTSGGPGWINASAIGTGALTFNGGILQAGGAFTVANDGLLNTTGGTIDANGSSFTYAGAIADGNGPGSLAIVNSASAPGTVVLTGANSYTGATTVAGGATLSLAGSGSIAASSGVALATGGVFDISGVANGGATIATLADAAHGQAGAVSLGGNTLTVSNGSTTFSGSLGMPGDTGGFTVAGGTQTLSGALGNYAGATAINAGATLVLTGGASLAASGGVTADGTLDVSGNGTTSLASLQGSGAVTLGPATLRVAAGNFAGTLGTVGDTGGLTKTGGGTFTFAGGSYAGTTTVLQGTLVQTGATANASAVAIAPGATLQTGAADVLGANAVVADFGTLVLNNHNQMIGSLVGNGTVDLGAATLTYTAAGSSFSGNLVGTGGFTKAGASTFAVSGASSFTGAVAVDGGTLEVNGSIASNDVTVNAGGTLAGTGVIGDPVINANGTLAAGSLANPYGTLTINGPLTFQPGSFFNVAISPAQNSLVKVNGATAINGGTVQVAAGAGTYSVNQRYTILTATGGVTGRFDTAVATNLAFLRPSLSYDPTDVVLMLAQANAFRSAAGTRNGVAVASALDAGVRGAAPFSPGATLIGGLDQLTAPQAQAAFASLSGEGLAAAQTVAHRSSQLFTAALFDQTTFYGAGSANQLVLTAPQVGRAYAAMAPTDGGTTTFQPSRLAETPIGGRADLPAFRPQFIETAAAAPTRTWRAWGTGFGADEDVRSNPAIGYAAQRNAILGGTVGVDYQVRPAVLIGVAAGGSDGSFTVPNRATSGTTTGGHVAGYTLASFGSLYGAASLSGSFYQNRTTRSVGGFGGLDAETERGTFNAREVRTRLEVGRGFAAGPYGTLTPFVALEVASLRSDGFGEHAIAGPGILGLDVAGQSAADVPSFMGLRLAGAASLGNGMVFRPAVQLAYVHHFAPERQVVAGIASLPGAVFLVDGARPARDAGQVKVGGELLVGAGASVFANFDGEFARASQLYGGKGGVKVVF